IAFNYIFDVNSDSTFNPNLKCECTVMNDTVPVIDGSLQLISIDHDQSGNIIFYNCQIFGYGFDFIKKVGEKYVQELDYSTISYGFNQSEIEHAWNNPFYVAGTNEYAVPMIDYAYGWSMASISSAQTAYVKNLQL